jgi:hypothetical protein
MAAETHHRECVCLPTKLLHWRFLQANTSLNSIRSRPFLSRRTRKRAGISQHGRTLLLCDLFKFSKKEPGRDARADRYLLEGPRFGVDRSTRICLFAAGWKPSSFNCEKERRNVQESLVLPLAPSQPVLPKPIHTPSTSTPRKTRTPYPIYASLRIQIHIEQHSALPIPSTIIGHHQQNLQSKPNLRTMT